MPRKNVISTHHVTTPQVKVLLESLGEENLDQFQRRWLDYASKFSKIGPKAAEELLNRLKKDEILEEDETVQIVNCMPRSIGELRVFLAGGRKIVETSKLESILTVLNEYKKENE